MPDRTEADNAIHTWQLPTGTATFKELSVSPGDAAVVVGANGSGKSALATWMQRQVAPERVRRLIAHRKLWFTHAGPQISPADNEDLRRNVSTWGRHDESRYLDHADSQRASMSLFDLLGQIHAQNAQLVDLYDSGMEPAQVRQQIPHRALDRLNKIFQGAEFSIDIVATRDQTFAVRNQLSGADYPIFQMSDGERSALLLAADVLGAPDHSVILVDEPERHLHPSISVGLIQAVINSRPDCGFVVFTHDIDLASAMSFEGHKTYVLSGCRWSNNVVSSWEMFEVPAKDALPETAKRAVLGGRRQVLCIEGDSMSIDRSLYSTLYPSWNLVAFGSCEQVIRAVTGIRHSSPVHWVQTVGIVDLDGRTPGEIAALRRQGVLTLPVSEVECLLYRKTVVSAVAGRQSRNLGGHPSPDEMVRSAIERAMGTLDNPTVGSIASKIAKERIIRSVAAHIPGDVATDSVQLDIPSDYLSLHAQIIKACRLPA